MFYLLENDSVKLETIDNINETRERSHLGILNFKELSELSGKLGISINIVFECLREVDISKYENHEGFDFIILNIPDDSDQRKKPHRVCIYYTGKMLLFISNNYEVINDMTTAIQNNKNKNICPGKIIHMFLDKLTFDDALVLEKIEQDISDLEEKLIMSKKIDMIDSLVAFRKKLMNLKRYYEQLLEISEAIEQNDNGLIEKKEMCILKFLQTE
jgi:magnesium transporter